MTAQTTNWEQELLINSLSQRARRAGAAYAGPGSASDGVSRIDVPPILFTAGVPDAAALPIDDLVATTGAVLNALAGNVVSVFLGPLFALILSYVFPWKY